MSTKEKLIKNAPTIAVASVMLALSAFFIHLGLEEDKSIKGLRELNKKFRTEANASAVKGNPDGIKNSVHHPDSISTANIKEQSPVGP